MAGITVRQPGPRFILQRDQHLLADADMANEIVTKAMSSCNARWVRNLMLGVTAGSTSGCLVGIGEMKPTSESVSLEAFVRIANALPAPKNRIASTPDTSTVSDKLAVFLDILEDISGDNIKTGILTVFRHINRMLSEEEFAECDRLLGMVTVITLPVEVSLAFLTITLAAKDRLPNRAFLMESLRILLLESRTQPDVDDLLSPVQ